MEQLKTCLVCGHPAEEAEVRYRRSEDALVRCPGCGLMFANPQYTPGELDGLYQRLYYSRENTTGPEREREHAVNRVLYRTVLDDLKQRYPQVFRASPGRVPLRVLDYGCGPGYFLAECREAGFEPTGIEFSEVAADYARDKLGLDVRTDPDAALPELPAGHYHLVTAWAVIEHTRRPRQVLEQLIEKLLPGGVLCLTVPNLSCWRYLLERGRWFNITNPTHLVFFDRSGLRRLLAELGMTRICRPVFWGGRPGFSAVANAAQYLVRLANLGSDLRIYAERAK